MQTSVGASVKHYQRMLQEGDLHLCLLFASPEVLLYYFISCWLFGWSICETQSENVTRGSSKCVFCCFILYHAGRYSAKTMHNASAKGGI